MDPNGFKLVHCSSTWCPFLCNVCVFLHVPLHVLNYQHRSGTEVVRKWYGSGTEVVRKWYVGASRSQWELVGASDFVSLVVVVVVIVVVVIVVIVVVIIVIVAKVVVTKVAYIVDEFAQLVVFTRES